MAGMYADDPAPRLAYDIDGTLVYRWTSSAQTSGGTPVLLSSSEMADLNDESESTYYDTTGAWTHWMWIFPEPIDMVSLGVYMTLISNGNAAGAISLSLINGSSAMTTDGFNGGWLPVTSGMFGIALVGPTGYRVMPRRDMTAYNGVRALKLTHQFAGYRMKAVHIYATPSSGSSRQLAFWEPSTDAEVGPAHFDFGDTIRGTTQKKTFRVKNLASTTATGVTLAKDILTSQEQTPSLTGQLKFSLDDSTYSDTVSLADIAPGAISSETVYVRHATDASAALSLFCARVKATATF